MNDYEEAPKRQRSKNVRDVTLMTLLAFGDNNSWKNSLELLKKYGKKAKDKYDLEKKLNELYIETNDKLSLEKEFAEIHPHKDWIFRTLPNEIVNAPNIQGTAVETKIDEMVNETRSSFEGSQEKKSCFCCANGHNNYSNFEGVSRTIQGLQKPDYINIIALVAVVGITFYALKNK